MRSSDSHRNSFSSSARPACSRPPPLARPLIAAMIGSWSIKKEQIMRFLAAAAQLPSSQTFGQSRRRCHRAGVGPVSAD